MRGYGNDALFQLAMAAMGFSGKPRDIIFHGREDIKFRKCLLKGCDNQTVHNGGYCCKEHHRLDNHREIKK